MDDSQSRMIGYTAAACTSASFFSAHECIVMDSKKSWKKFHEGVGRLKIAPLDN